MPTSRLKERVMALLDNPLCLAYANLFVIVKINFSEVGCNMDNCIIYTTVLVLLICNTFIVKHMTLLKD